ncbi:MAG: hypothetical protein Q9166_005853 [cf. Caloplaca sp. 2 TL-2023]
MTKVPGPTSFTRALIFALKTLVKEKNEGRFTTDELLRKIKTDAPHFPKDQTPVMSDREHKKSSAGRIILHPLRPDRAVQETPKEGCLLKGATGYVVTLHFHFGDKPPDDHLETLGRNFNEIFERNTLEVHRVRWGGMRTTMFTRATKRFQDSLHKRRASNNSQRPTEINDLAPTNGRLTAYSTGSVMQNSAGDGTPLTRSSPATPFLEDDIEIYTKDEMGLFELAGEGNLGESLQGSLAEKK